MAGQSSLHFYPERVAWIGALILGTTFFLAVPYVFDSGSSFIRLNVAAVKDVSLEPYAFSLGLEEKGPLFPVPNLEGEMTFSLDPPRPDGALGGQRLLVRMKKSAESRRVTLPCRLDLEIQRDKLVFAKEGSPFWIELSAGENGQIEGRGTISSADQGKIDAGTFLAAVQDCPIQAAQEFPEGSPFRILAEARWLGRDQFRAQYEMASLGERVEVGTEFFELNEGDWLVWKDKSWQKYQAAEKGYPIAHIQSLTGKGLVLEGWDLEGYVRLSLASAPLPPFKMKGEELFSAIRIRSEKQISCMLEKQCMVLKAGDWVLKANGRWKILRKEQERAAYLNEKLYGELFVFDQIQARQGQKMIQGRLFNPGRTQSCAIELPAQSARKVGEKGFRKGKSP